MQDNSKQYRLAEADTYSNITINAAKKAGDAKNPMKFWRGSGNKRIVSVIDPNIVYTAFSPSLILFTSLCMRNGPHVRDGGILNKIILALLLHLLYSYSNLHNLIVTANNPMIIFCSSFSKLPIPEQRQDNYWIRN